MNRKLVFLATLMLFLSGISLATLEVQRVEASGIIYIRTDGSIEPPTAELSSNDNVTYTMTGNLRSSIVIEKDNIVFDGAGHAIQGSGSGNGIELWGRNNVTIENVEVRGFYQGIIIYKSSRGNNVLGIRAMYNSYGGIQVDSSTNNNVTGNMVVGGNEGITLSGNGGNNSVVRNNIEGTEFYGMNLISTSNNLIKNNKVSNCVWHGICLWMSSCNNVVVENNVTECKVGIEVSYSSNNNTVSSNRFSMNRIVGVVIGFRIPESGPEWGGAADNRVIGNDVTRNNLGIELIYSKNNTIFHNNIEENNNSVAIIGSYFNVWDDGAIGNYWSDYLGTDANHDGIGDTPYVIDANNADHYPLMARALNKQDETPPITTHDYNNLWKNRDFTILLSATDDLSGVAETHYRINNGIAKSIPSDGQPTITIENGNNTLEYWSVDRGENEETPHKILAGIKLDKSSPKASIDGTQSAKVGTTLSFDAGNSTDNMGIASCYWSLGDGRTGTGSSIDHSYDNSGVYEVTLMVKDMANNTDTVSMTVTVTSEGFSLLGLDLIQIAGIVVASIVAVVAVAWVLLKRRR